MPQDGFKMVLMQACTVAQKIKIHFATLNMLVSALFIILVILCLVRDYSFVHADGIHASAETIGLKKIYYFITSSRYYLQMQNAYA